MVYMVTIKDLEERPNGTYYLGPLEEAKAFTAEWLAYSESRYTLNGEFRYAVFLSLNATDGEQANVNNYDSCGHGDTAEEAWRYALGSEFGPADDEFNAFPLTHDKFEAVYAMVEHHFPERLDAFYSKTTGLAAVEDTDGNMWRVWPDGDIEVYRR